MLLPPVEKDVPGDVAGVVGGTEKATLGEADAVESILAFPSAREGFLGHALLGKQARATLP